MAAADAGASLRLNSMVTVLVLVGIFLLIDLDGISTTEEWRRHNTGQPRNHPSFVVSYPVCVYLYI